MAVITTNKTCLRKAKNQLEKHQMGFDGEHIGEVVLRRLGYKEVKLTSHKAKFDILTARESWEIKTVGLDAEYHQMSVKAKQKLEKLAWAKKNKKHPKSMLVIVNDSAEVYIRDGLGKFRAGGMKKVKTYKDWRKEVGHGRTERLVEGKPAPVFVPAKTFSLVDIDDSLKNEIRNALNEAMTTLGISKTKLAYFGDLRGAKKGLGYRPLLSDKVWGSTEIDGETIGIILGKPFKNAKFLQERIKRASEVNFHKYKNVGDVIWHEMGHVLQNENPVINLTRVSNILEQSRRVVQEVIETDKGALLSKVLGRYSLSRSDEAVSEAIALFKDIDKIESFFKDIAKEIGWTWQNL